MAEMREQRTPPRKTELLRTEGLSRRFEGLVAVDRVDFSLPEGQIRAIIGPNGAGKSTFVGLLAGRIRPTEGRVFLGGEDVTRLPPHARVRRGLAYTFQITNIYPSMTVLENASVAAEGRPGRAGEAAIRQAALAVLAQVGLAPYAESRAGALAYGHQRLLEVAMGLALKPRLLILDEPTQGLSDAEVKEFIALVKRVAESATVLLIEHNMDVVMALAERITVFDQGRILAEGTPDEIRADPAVQAAYLGGAA